MQLCVCRSVLETRSAWLLACESRGGQVTCLNDSSGINNWEGLSLLRTRYVSAVMASNRETTATRPLVSWCGPTAIEMRGKFRETTWMVTIR